MFPGNVQAVGAPLGRPLARQSDGGRPPGAARRRRTAPPPGTHARAVTVYAWRAAQFPRKEVDMRSAIVSFIMVVVMAGAVTAQEWGRIEEVDPITDLTSRFAGLVTDIMSEATSVGTTGVIFVLCREQSDGFRKFVGVRKTSVISAWHRRLLNSYDEFKYITVRWDSDEPEIQRWRGPKEMLMISSTNEDEYISMERPGRPPLRLRRSLTPSIAVNEFITNIVQKDRLVIRAADFPAGNVTYVFDIGNADTKEAMDWVMEKCNVGNATDSTTPTTLRLQPFFIANQDLYVIGLVGLFVIGLIVARRYQNRPRW